MFSNEAVRLDKHVAMTGVGSWVCQVMVKEGAEAVQRHVHSRWGDIQCRYLDARCFEILMLEVLMLDILALYYTSGGRFLKKISSDSDE